MTYKSLYDKSKSSIQTTLRFGSGQLMILTMALVWSPMSFLVKGLVLGGMVLFILFIVALFKSLRPKRKEALEEVLWDCGEDEVIHTSGITSLSSNEWVSVSYMVILGLFILMAMGSLYYSFSISTSMILVLLILHGIFLVPMALGIHKDFIHHFILTNRGVIIGKAYFVPYEVKPLHQFIKLKKGGYLLDLNTKKELVRCQVDEALKVCLEGMLSK